MTVLPKEMATTGLILSLAGIGNIIGVLIMRYTGRSQLGFIIKYPFNYFGKWGSTNLLNPSIMMACIGMMIFDGALSMAFTYKQPFIKG